MHHKTAVKVYVTLFTVTARQQQGSWCCSSGTVLSKTVQDQTCLQLERALER